MRAAAGDQLAKCSVGVAGSCLQAFVSAFPTNRAQMGHHRRRRPLDAVAALFLEGADWDLGLRLDGGEVEAAAAWE